jgi:hypothetical protein
MASKASELAGIASIHLQIAKDEIIATSDPETISWALDQFRQAEALLRLLMADCDISSGKVGVRRGVNAGAESQGLMPILSDQNPCAQSCRPMDMIRRG